MDRTPHFRSFQNLNETYLDVMNRISAFYGSHGVIAESCVQQETVDFLLQYKETDWTFVRPLWPGGYTCNYQGRRILLCRKCQF